MSRRGRAIEAARAEFKAFHWGNESTEIIEAEAPQLRAGQVLMVLGELHAVEYDTEKGAEVGRYCHDFEHEKPLLCSTADGQLVIVGGQYRVTPRGIVG
jgi:hypothetical protein